MSAPDERASMKDLVPDFFQARKWRSVKRVFARFAQSLPETYLSDSTEVVNEVGLGHTDTGVPDGKGLGLLVGGNSDVEILLGVELAGVGEGSVPSSPSRFGGQLQAWSGARRRSRDAPDLVKGIGTVGDELSEEDLLVGVELLVVAACAKSQRWLHRVTQTRSQRTNGVDDEVQKLGDLSLETEGLGVGGRHDGREKRRKKEREQRWAEGSREIKGSAKSSAQSTHRASQFLLCPLARPARGCTPQNTEERKRTTPHRVDDTSSSHLHSPTTQLLQPRPCWRARTSLPPLLRVVIRREIRETGRRDSRRCLTRNLARWWERDRGLLPPNARTFAAAFEQVPPNELSSNLGLSQNVSIVDNETIMIDSNSACEPAAGRDEGGALTSCSRQLEHAHGVEFVS